MGPGAGQPRITPDRVVIISKRTVVVILLGIGKTAVIVGNRIVRIALDRLTIVGNCVVKIILPKVSIASVIVR